MLTVSTAILQQKPADKLTAAEKHYLMRHPAATVKPEPAKKRLVVATDFCKTEAEVTAAIRGMGVTNEIFFTKRYPAFADADGSFSKINLVEYLFERGFLTDEQRKQGNKLSGGIILWAVYKALAAGVFPVKAGRQTAIYGYTPIRFSTGFTGKMEGKAAFTTCSLVNPLCLIKMKNPEFVCSQCFAEATANQYLEGAINWTQNLFFETCSNLPDILIPLLDRGRRDCHYEKYKSGIRIESYGDTANVQHQIFYNKLCEKNSGWLFTQWTKNPAYAVKAFDDYGKPANLKLGLSGYEINKFPEKIYTKFAKTGYIDFVFLVTNSEDLKMTWLKDLRTLAYPCMCDKNSCAHLCGECYGKAVPGRLRVVVEMLRPQNKK